MILNFLWEITSGHLFEVNALWYGSLNYFHLQTVVVPINLRLPLIAQDLICRMIVIIHSVACSWVGLYTIK